MIKTEALRRRERRQALLTVVFTIISVIYLMPVLLVLINSLKANAFVNTETFKLPTAESFVGLKNYVKGMTFGNFAFYKVVFYSFFITITSTALILLCTSMAAWYISRVGSLVSKIVYYLCVFSMVVPFQMVMYTLARTADQVHLNTPWTIPVVYLGFGAGLAVFMFTGFVKSLPLEIEEAAAIDGCGPVGTFFRVVLPMLKPTMISVGVLEIMWVWNDYLLPSLVLDINQYRTIPIHIQYLKGSYGTVDMGATMALIMLSILPVIIFYLCCQKHIIKGVAAGAVKGEHPLDHPRGIPGLRRGPCRVYVHGLCQESAAGDRGGRRHRRLRPGGHLLPGGAAYAEAHHDLRGRAGDHVGMERLSAAQSGAGHQPVPHHPHPHSVPQGQLRHRGHGRHHGPDHAEHPAGDHLLSLLPEAHHQGRGCRSREGLRRVEPPLGGRG